MAMAEAVEKDQPPVHPIVEAVVVHVTETGTVDAKEEEQFEERMED